MPDDIHAFRIFVGDDREIGIFVDHKRCVDQLAINFAGQGCFGQARADAGRDVHHADRLVERTL